MKIPKCDTLYASVFKRGGHSFWGMMDYRCATNRILALSCSEQQELVNVLYKLYIKIVDITGKAPNNDPTIEDDDPSK